MTLAGVSLTLWQSRFTSPRRGEVGMCAPRAHIPGEGVTNRYRAGPLTRIAQARSDLSPARTRACPSSAPKVAQVGYIRLGLKRCRPSALAVFGVTFGAVDHATETYFADTFRRSCVIRSSRWPP